MGQSSHQTPSTGIIEQREICRAILAIQKQAQVNGSFKIKRLSVDRSCNDAPRPASQMKMGEKSPSVEKPTRVHFPLATSAASPPIRSTVFVAMPEPSMPDTRSSQGPKEEPIMEKASSDSEDCTGGAQQHSANSSSDQSPQGSNPTLRDNSNNKNQHEEPEVLDLWFIKPCIEDNFGRADGVFLYWIVYKLPIPQAEIQNLLDKDQQESLPPLVELLQDLTAHENASILKTIEDAGFGASLISLKRTHTDMSHRGILFKGVPGLQFAVMRKKSQIEKQKKGYHAHGAYSPHAMGRQTPDIERMTDQRNMVDLQRPPYIKVHRKHLSPDTLNAYDLPWEWVKVS